MIKLLLSPEHLAVIGRALGAQPYDAVCAVVAELQRQINEQQPTQGPLPRPTPEGLRLDN